MSVAQPLSLATALEQEYVYFHGEVPPRQWRCSVDDLRDPDRLLARLAVPSALPPRYEKLRAIVRAEADVMTPGAVVGALNSMLDDESLLPALCEDQEFRSALLETHEGTALLSKLLRVRKARRLLLDYELTQLRIFSSDELLETAISWTPGMADLWNDPQVRTVIEAEPSLLSTIADHAYVSADGKVAGLESYLLSDPDERKARRASLVRLFSSDRDWRRTRRFLSTVPGLHRLSPTRRAIDPLAHNSEALHDALLTGRRPARVVPEAIPTEHLRHFNMLLLEFAYAGDFGDEHDVKAIYQQVHRKDMVALCLSGGGIRSATFNLGVLQGLADRGVLSRIHYLSTVSGGGYIGSWLSSWMRRHSDGAWGVAAELCGRPPDAQEGSRSRIPCDPLQPEPKPIQHLREYSSYLAPRRTVTSPDAWTLVAIYLRNLLLNWTMLLPALFAVLAIPRLLVSSITIAPGLEGWDGGYVGLASIVFATLSVIVIGFQRPSTDEWRGKPLPTNRIAQARSLYWLIPLYASGWTFSLFWASLDGPTSEMPTRFGTFDVLSPVNLAITFAVANGLAGVVYAIRRAVAKVTIEPPSGRVKPVLFVLSQLTHKDVLLRALIEIVAAAAAGVLGAILLVMMFRRAFPQELLFGNGIETELYVMTAVPLFLFVFFVEATLLAGITTKFSTDYDREWYARSAALIFLWALFHLAGSFCVLLGPVFLTQLPELWAGVGGVSAVVAWILARSGKTAANAKEQEMTGASRHLARTLKLVTTIALLVVLAFISLLFTRFLGTFLAIPVPLSGPERLLFQKANAATWHHLRVLHETPLLTVFSSIIVLGAIAFVVSYILNVNVYSMHGMYRTRLIRAYLGASRSGRNPDPFTGFDPHDNLAMWQLRPELLWASSFRDVHAFVDALSRDDHILRQLPAIVQGAVAKAARTGQTPEDVCADLLGTMNRLMVAHDLRYAVDAPPSLELLRRNRQYLEERYADHLRPLQRESSTPAVTDDDRHTGPVEPHQRRTPLHIINTTLNLVGGENLAWQERKGDSMTVSALHAGNRRLGYRDTFRYGGPDGISLGTALAISGAAVSPNMGYNSSPTVTFLMTLLNARLGWWLGNPGAAGARTYPKAGPRNSIRALIREALGWTRDTAPYVFLSDGGHFENLGMYEMVLRRCRYIIACDASADRKYAFGDLANAVRKIRVDLGVPIEFKSVLFIGPQEHGRLGRYCALADILYDRVDGQGANTGKLLYIKPAVYEDCPPDVKNYQKEGEGFPHETTADQFFSESQFESYRALGRHVIDQIAMEPDNGAARDWRARSVEDFFQRSTRYLATQRQKVGEVTLRNLQMLLERELA